MFRRLLDAMGTTKFEASFHLWATRFWAAMVLPSIIWWSDSVPWLVLMSVWANLASHWSAHQAARAELAQQENN